MNIRKRANDYLSRIRIKPELENSFLAKYVVNIRLVLLFIIFIMGFGLVGFSNLPKRLNPEVQIPIVFVSTILPGAGPEDVESLLTVPIEDAIQTVENVNTITSTSEENISAIQIEFESTVEPEKARNDVQTAVDTVTDLPDDAGKPNVIALDFEDIPVWTFAVTSDKDLASLTRFGEILKNRLEELPSVNVVRVTGLEEQEIQIKVRPEIVEATGISPIQISALLQAQLNSYPGGAISTGDNTFSLTIDPLVETIDDIRNIQITLQDQQYSLSDIAVVSRKSEPNQPISLIASKNTEAKRSLTFSVFKIQSANIDTVAEIVKAEAEEVVAEFNGAFEVISITDFGEDIQTQFDELLRNISITILLVFVTLFAFSGVRAATIASFTIPLSFLVTLGVMNLIGLSINFLSLFSLILTLGLLVDTAIVVITAMNSYFVSGRFTPQQTGVLVFKDFVTPISTSTLTTVWAFVPLLLATGIIGEFILTIPVVVITTIVASTLIALFITLPLMVQFLHLAIPRRTRILFTFFSLLLLLALVGMMNIGNPLLVPIIIVAIIVLSIFIISFPPFLKNLTKTTSKGTLLKVRILLNNGIVTIDSIKDVYQSILRKIIDSKSNQRKTVFMVVGIFIFSILLVGTGQVRNEFFPKTDEDTLYVSVELPAGTGLEVTTPEAERVLKILKTTPYINYAIAEIGAQIDQTSISTGTETNRVRYSLLLEEERESTSTEIADNLRESFSSYQKGEVQVVEVSGGPPVGSDLEIKLLGEDLGTLQIYADKLIRYLKNLEGTTNVDKSITQGPSKIAFIPDRSKLSEQGVTVESIGLWMRTFASGFELETVTFDSDEEESVVFRYEDGLRSPEEISTLSIPNQTGELIPLLSLGRLTLEPNPTRITREDDQRSISVSASVVSGFNAVELGAQLEDYAENELGLAEGYSWSTGGVNEENERSVQSIIQAMGIAFLLILGTMVVQFKSYRKALIVLLVIPLALSGVFIIFAISGTALSFPALIGVLALFGIVVNNSIMIIEKIGQNEAQGIPHKESIIDAGVSRLEPILYSSLTTIIGLIPITIQDPLWRGLGGAIIAGLSFSGAIMLFFIPTIYAMWFGESEKGQ